MSATRDRFETHSSIRNNDLVSEFKDVWSAEPLNIISPKPYNMARHSTLELNPTLLLIDRTQSKIPIPGQNSTSRPARNRPGEDAQTLAKLLFDVLEIHTMKINTGR